MGKMRFEEIKSNVHILQEKYKTAIKDLFKLVPHTDENVRKLHSDRFTSELFEGLENKGLKYDMAAFTNKNYEYMFSRMNEENGIKNILKLLVQGYIAERILLDKQQ